MDGGGVISYSRECKPGPVRARTMDGGVYGLTVCNQLLPPPGVQGKALYAVGASVQGWSATSGNRCRFRFPPQEYDFRAPGLALGAKPGRLQRLDRATICVVRWGLGIAIVAWSDC